MAKPNWKLNKIAPIDECKDDFICAGLHDVNNRHDDLLWFTNEEDLEYICKALNFYETYSPLFRELKEDLEKVLEHIEEVEKSE